MTSKISTVANLALQVFSQHSTRVASAAAPHQSGQPSRDQLRRLIGSLTGVTQHDVGFDHRWITDAVTYQAPVVYVHIMENEVFSMGIFVLRPGSRIPLHDHPGMFGIVKVIFGSVRVRSFSRISDVRPSPSLQQLLPLSRWQLNDLVVARPHQDTVLTADTDPSILTPQEGNFHELVAVDSGAAFLDILAPPYDHDLGTRECRFYKEVSLPFRHHSPQQPTPPVRNGFSTAGSNNQQTSPSAPVIADSALSGAEFSPTSASSGGPYGDIALHGCVYLIETHQPKDYWCESAEYRGPKVT